jgi:hypothetical protein
MFRGEATLAAALRQREARPFHGSFSECLYDRKFRSWYELVRHLLLSKTLSLATAIQVHGKYKNCTGDHRLPLLWD